MMYRCEFGEGIDFDQILDEFDGQGHEVTKRDFQAFGWGVPCTTTMAYGVTSKNNVLMSCNVA